MNNVVINLLLLLVIIAVLVSCIFAYISHKAGAFKEKSKGAIEKNKALAEQVKNLSSAAISSVGDVGNFLLKRADRKTANNDNKSD